MGLLKEPVAELDREWRRHSREVRRLHEKLFYRPLLAAVAKLPSDQARLSPKAAEQQLAALGYEDPKGALRHLEALTSGVSRTANIQRTLLPAMLGWFADAPNPDAGLWGFRQISEALGSTHWYLQTLRDEGQVAQRLATVLASSRYATDLLQRAPEGVRMLATDEALEPLGRAALQKEMTAAARRHTDPVEAVKAVRAIRRRELFRIAVADLFEVVDVAQVGSALTDVTAATLEAALTASVLAIEAERRTPMPTRIAIVAMGRFGGYEMGFGSDADVMFVHDPLPGANPEEASRAARDVANEFRRLLSLPGTDPELVVDADLRPEGKQGPLVRTLESYARYYAQWSAVWEAQALLRASAMVGDEDLCRRFTELIDPLRFPPTGISDGRRPGGTSDQGPGRRRAAAPRGGPGHPPQARTRRPGRRGVDGPAAADAARRRRTRPAHDPHPGRAAGRRRRRPALAGGRGVPGGRLARWRAGCATRSRTCGAGRPTSCPATPGSGRPWRTSGATRRGRPTGSSTTTCGSPGGRGRSSSGCSGAEAATAGPELGLRPRGVTWGTTPHGTRRGRWDVLGRGLGVPSAVCVLLCREG